MSLFHFGILLLCGIGLAGCAQQSLPELAIQDDWVPETTSTAALPEKKPIVRPRAQVLEKPVSLNLAAPVSLKEVFLELGKLASLPIQVTADVIGSGGVSVYQQPVYRVINQVCQAHKLRARWYDNTVVIERDLPYVQTYTVPFLALKRRNRIQTLITNDVEENSKALSQGSSLLEGEVQNDAWAELAQTLDTLLGIYSHSKPLVNTRLPDQAAGGAHHVTPSKGNTSPSPSVEMRSPDQHAGADLGLPHYTCHKQAGVLVVRGTSEHHRTLRQYLKKLHQQLGSQVLIEAKILEVALHDTYKSGINWRAFRGAINARAPIFSGATPLNGVGSLSVDQLFTLGVYGSDMSIALRALAHFGQVRTLSNPRLTVMNNQPAILKVAHNYVYFTAREVRHYRQNQADYVPPILATTESKVHSVPIGLIMVVQPAIDVGKQEVVLSLKPTISVISKLISDPMIALASEQRVVSQVPVTEVRELDSVLRLKSGGVAIVGGLMQERTGYQREALPGTENLGAFGNLFANTDRESEKTELVILLRATLIDSPALEDKEEEGDQIEPLYS